MWHCQYHLRRQFRQLPIAAADPLPSPNATPFRSERLDQFAFLLRDARQNDRLPDAYVV
jgi:hypothetical protein